ncbi:MAG: hypothetical protein JXP34_16490 [Planctomycetes bacterium]|nr:hypothetical protein [Planctomycetota bacterium]
MTQAHSRSAVCALLVAVGIALPGSAGAATINVPDASHTPPNTIQGGINAASPGDEVVVAPGTYNEDVSIALSVTLRSSGGHAVTTIQGTGTTSAVTVTGAGVVATIQGFRITGGTGTSVAGEFRGGGIRIHGVASATVTANDITGNGVTSGTSSEGGGIHAINCPDLNVTDNLIRENNAYVGAGLCIETCPDYVLRGNTIDNNGTVFCGFAGGLVARYTSTGGTIEANVVYGNRGSVYGGGLDVWSSATLLNNIVYENYSNNGGGVYLYTDASPQTFLLLHNTFAHNTAGLLGAGVLVHCSNGTVDLQGNIIYFNRIGASPSNLVEASMTTPPTVYVNYNDIESPDTSFWGGTPTGNMTSDPLFVNAAAGDYHIDPVTPSPCKDMAIPHALLTVDFEGDGRDATPDIGADEIPSSGPSKPTGLACVPDGDGDGVVLSWTNNGTGGGGTDYDAIEIHRVGATSNPIATLAGIATTYTDDTALAGTFTYFVRGVEAATDYDSDPCTNATPVPVEEPTGLACAIQPDDDTIRITWTNDDDPYTNVKVFRDGSEVADLSAPVSLYDDLVYAGSYAYHLVAYVGTDASPASASVSSGCAAPVEAPGGVACSVVDGDTIRISWNNDADDPYTNIELYRGSTKLADVTPSAPGTPQSYDDVTAYAGEFTYHLIAYVGGDASPESGSCASTTNVEAPTGVTCTVVPPDGVRVEWNDDPDDPYTKVEVYRDGGYLGEVGGGIESYLDDTAGAGTYEYRLRAYVGTLASPYSGTCQGTPPTEGPASLTCSTPTATTASLDWTNRDPYDAIKILRDGNPYDVAAGAAQTYTDASTGGTGHTYAVVGVVEGTDSDPSNDCTTSVTVAAPTGLSCPSPSPHTVNLSWTNGAAYDSVEVYRDSSPLVTLGGSATTHDDTTVDGGPHTYQVRGRIGGADSPFSDPCAVTVAVEAPDDVVCTPGAQDGVTLHWTNNDAYTGIDIVRDGGTIASLGGSETTYPDGAVESGTHVYRVVGRIGAGSGASEECGVTVPLDRPTDLSCVATGADEVELGWTNDDPYDDIEIRRDGTLIATISGTATSHTDTFGGGGGGGAYAYTVTGVRLAQTASSTPCGVVVPVEGPSGLTCTPGGSVDLSWTNNDPYASIEIERDGSSIATLPGTDTSYSDATGGGGEHSYAVHGIVDGIPTPDATCDVTVPVAGVADLACLATGPDEVTLSWTNPEAYTGFEILRDGTSIATLPAGSTSHVDAAAGGGARTYAVIGSIGAVASAPETCALDVPVDAPSDLLCTPHTDDSVDLSWVNEDVYDEIEILKDGGLIATLAGTATTYTDAGDGNGTHTFAVRGRIGAVTGAPATCEVKLGVEAPSDLTCDFTGSVALTWINNDPYDGIDVVRDGTVIASLGPGIASYLDSGADPGPHSYVVIGRIGAESAQSAPCDVGVPLPPVSALSCSASGFDVQLSWINGYAYEEVQVFRNGGIVATLPGTTSTATDTVPSVGNYQYWVRGLYREVLSDGTTDECAVTIDVTPPVQNLQCAVEGWTVTLTWQNPATYDEVKVYRGGSLIATLPGSPATYQEDVPGPGDYTYAVVGAKGGVDAEAAECLAHVTFIPAPTDLACTVLDFVNVRLAWTNGMAYAAIVVSRNGTDIATLDGTAITYDDLAPGVGTFQYGVRGVVGASASAPATCEVGIEAPASVTALACDPSGFDVALTWTNGGTYTAIAVLRGGSTIATLPGTATSHTDTVAAPGSYTYDVVPSSGPLSAPPATCNPTVTYVPPVGDLVCQVVYREIAMTWTNGFAYTGITVRRDGASVATLSGTATTYSELGPSGSHVYDVIGHVDPYASAPTGCEATLSSFAPPQNLTCAANRHNNLLSWSNGAMYTAIRIVRDGSTIATVGGTLTSFVDPTGRGTFLYELFGVIGGQSSETAASCSVTNDYVDPPVDLACDLDREAKEVTLGWTNGETYANVEIQRNGLVIATLGGAATSYVDTVPSEAAYTYAVIGIVGAYRSDQATCTVRFGTSFIRSDANADGETDIGDAVSLLDYLFAHAAPLLCLDAGDANADQVLDIGDAIWILSYLFQDGPAPAAPFPSCGQTPEAASMGCESFPPCEAP